MERPVPHLLLVAAFGLLIGCQPAGEAPPDPPQEQATPAQTGAGTGGGQGAGTGGGRSGECSGNIVLTLDGTTIWRRTRDELAADPAVRPIPGFRDGDVPGVRLEELLAGLDSMRSVLVRACGPRGMQLKAGQLMRAPLYLVLGGSGRWRLVDLANPEAPTIFVRDVARIEASTRDAPRGRDSPDH